MGIWSCPIGASPAKFVVDVDKIKERMVPKHWEKLTNHGTFVGDRDGKLKGHVTWEKCIMVTFDTAKIYGYLDRDEYDAWTNLFTVLTELYPEQTKPWKAHFWCSDEGLPFSITYESGKVYLYIGRSNDAAYTTFDKRVNPDEKSPYKFNPANYIECVEKHNRTDVEPYGFTQFGIKKREFESIISSDSDHLKLLMNSMYGKYHT